MKALLFALLLTGGASDEAPSIQEICKHEAQVAETIMMSRQMGMPVDEVLDIFDEHRHGLILEIYRRPRWHGVEAALRAVEEVYNDFRVECEMHLRGQKR